MVSSAGVSYSTGSRALAPSWPLCGGLWLPERIETSLTLFVKLKQHILLVELLGLRADSQLNEGAAIQAEPAGALLQDLPPFVRDADG